MGLRPLHIFWPSRPIRNLRYIVTCTRILHPPPQLYGHRMIVQVFGAGAPMQWLKLPSWKIGDREFKPHSGLQVSNKVNVSSSLARKDSILWGASVTER